MASLRAAAEDRATKQAYQATAPALLLHGGQDRSREEMTEIDYRLQQGNLRKFQWVQEGRPPQKKRCVTGGIRKESTI